MRNASIIFILIFFFSASTSLAEVIKADSYIMEWILLGPITNTGPATISTR